MTQSEMNGRHEKQNHKTASELQQSSFEKTFGFRSSDLTSWDAFIRLMNRPTHPASLAVFRVCYGLLMLIDTMDERGLANALQRWGDEEQCRFPLIHGLQPLETHWMVVLHIITALGALGIMLGFMFRQSCILFAVPYWFMFILEKMRWNNHSYLFGLVSIILLFSDANRCWSLDGLIWREERHTHVPLWNYTIPRFQIWILYFIAGLKKFDSDWTHGYSMNLASNFAFAPLRTFLDKETINMFFVHTCGHMIDLFLVYLLFFDKTRKIGIMIGLLFNGMNATMFNIGMFPYMCIVSLPIFCSTDWPVHAFRKLPKFLRHITPLDDEPQPSEHCIYTKEQIQSSKQSEDKVDTSSEKEKDTKPVKKSGILKNMKNKISTHHKLATVLVLAYMSEQLFLPYSHFITQGYNGWTNGLYGYSWDMMIHSWSVQFVKVQFVQKDTKEVGYLRSNAFVRRTNRWSSNADMIKQYAQCMEERLAARNTSNIELYIDVWKSMNKRFQQRVIDPRVNILKAQWHPFKKTPWLMPLLIDLSDWRIELDRIMKATYNASNYTNIVFAADFPGLHLSNYIQEEISDANLTVLQGEVMVEILNELEDGSTTSVSNTTLKINDTISLPIGQFHNVHTVSPTPSCYYYVFIDRIAKEKYENFTRVTDKLKQEQGINDTKHLNVTILETDSNETISVKNALSRVRMKKEVGYYDGFKQFFNEKINMIYHTMDSVKYAWEILWHRKDPQLVKEEMRNASIAAVQNTTADSDVPVDDPGVDDGEDADDETDTDIAAHLV